MGINGYTFPHQCGTRQNQIMSPLSKNNRYEIVRFRIENAVRTLDEAEVQIQNKYYNTAVNRMYYACYYAICALLVANNIHTKSHDGVRRMMSLHFIKTGILPTELGRYYGRLFSNRLTGDYDDFFSHDRASAGSLYPEAKVFVNTVKTLVDEWLDKQADSQKA